MEKEKALRVILLSILVSYTVCEVAEEPNHLFAESPREVTGFKISARHADVPLRSGHHNFPVQISTITDSFSSDDERIGSLDGRVLPASENALKSMKWTTDDNIRNVSTVRRLKFAMRHSARRHNVLKSSHGARMPSSASILKDSKAKEAFTFQNTSPTSITGVPYKTKITAPFKLTILPTGETVIPSVDTADAESDWISKGGNTTGHDDQKSPHSNDHEENSSPHGKPRVTGHEGSTRHAGTSAMPQHKLAVHPGLKASSGLRWKAAYDHVKLDDSKKGKHFKNKKKKSHSEDEDPVDSSSPAATVVGILAGMLMLLFIFTGVPRLWRILNKRWRRRTNRQLGSNFPSAGYFSDELSEEEIIFDRSVMERNKKSSKGASPRTTPEAFSGRSKSAPSSYQSPDHPTQEQKIWTLTDTPRSTPLIAVPTLADTPRTEVWTVNKIPETKSLDCSSTTSSLSDLSTEKPTETSRSVCSTSVSIISLVSETEICDSDLASSTRSSAPTYDLTDKTVTSSLPFTTQPRVGPPTSHEQTTSESLLSPHPSTPSLSSLPTASDESTPSISMTTDSTSSSTESCKTPVTARNDVVITMDDEDEKIIYPSNKSGSQVLSAVKDACKESSKEEVVLTMGLDDDEESSMVSESESESSSGELIYTSEKAEMKNVTSCDAIIDIMGSDNNTEETSAINEKSNEGRAHPTDAVRPKVKREVEWEDESTNPLDTGASTSKNAKIRVLNHKDYKTWKELQKDIKMKKTQGVKPRDVLQGLQAIRGIYNLPRIPVDPEGGCLCYYCEKHIKRAQREKIFKLASSKLFSFKLKSSAYESPSGSESSSSTSSGEAGPSTSSAANSSSVVPSNGHKFAKDIILPCCAQPRDAVRPKAKREVLREDKPTNSLERSTSTSNSPKIRVLNHKHYKTWKELQKDIKMKKAQGVKPRDVLQGLQTIRDIYNLPRIPVDPEGGCLCYYCEKHIKRARREKFFKLPSKLFSLKSKSSASESPSGSESSSSTSSAAAGPSTSSAANFDSGVPSNRFDC